MYENEEYVDVTAIPDLGASFKSGPLNVVGLDFYAISILYAYGGGDDSTGTVKLQTSLTGGSSDLEWADYQGSDQTYDNAAQPAIYQVRRQGERFVRVVTTFDTGTGGTGTIGFNKVQGIQQ